MSKTITFSPKGISPIANPVCVSFFHGVGGMSLGAKRVGFDTLLATDRWEGSEKFFNLNHPDGCFLREDMFKLTATDILNKIKKHHSLPKFNGRDIDAVLSGSPCQGMSGANYNRHYLDYRNYLMLKQIRLAGTRGLNAKAAWFEQVPGFCTRDMKRLQREVSAALRAQTDYYFDMRVLNSVDYGGTQSRNRLTILMVRKDVGEPSFPVPVEPDMSKVSIAALLSKVLYLRKDERSPWLEARTCVSPTITVSDKYIQVMTAKGVRLLSIAERLILCGLADGSLATNGLTNAEIITLCGNMVQIPFAEAIMRHIKEEILLQGQAIPLRLAA